MYKNQEDKLRYDREYYWVNRDKILEYKRKYQLEHYKDKIKERKHKHYWKNREQILQQKREYNKEYYKLNKDRILASHKKWWRSESGKLWDRIHKMKEKKDSPRLKEDVILLLNVNQAIYGTICCENCREQCNSNYQIDHIIPTSLGGISEFDNLQILCAPCNIEKRANAIDFRHYKEDCLLGASSPEIDLF